MCQTVRRRLLHELLALPTAPFAEHQVVDYVERFCARREAVSLRRDPAGNVLLTVRRGAKRARRPVCLTAHMDHPGFVAASMIGPRRLSAFWRGGVPVEYFKGARVRFDVNGRWVRGTVRSTTPVIEHQRLRVDTTEIDVDAEVPPASIGMWDFPDPRVRRGRIHARGCDDIAGVAAVLACVEEACRSRAAVAFHVLLTRAEEVGFVGAIAACRARTLPRKGLVVTVETSSRLPTARLGDGPILRVGDKSSAFTPAATAYCEDVARALTRKNPSFRFQRKLMDGGTCEASVFCRFGYDATGVCLALGHYHNVDRTRGRLAAEYIDLNDYDRLVDWFIALVRARRPYEGVDRTLMSRIARIERSYARLLRATVHHPA